MDINNKLLEELFSALGDHLERAVSPFSIVVVGGASMAALGLIERTTKDVDVIASAHFDKGEFHLSRATPFPDSFLEAIQRVARDFGLPDEWLNGVIDKQWNTGLPPGLSEHIEWRTYSALKVGFVGRGGLIPLKFFAVVDQGSNSKHWQDLLALQPTGGEIKEAASWVRSQDEGLEFKDFVNQVSDELRQTLEGHRSDDQ